MLGNGDLIRVSCWNVDIIYILLTVAALPLFWAYFG